MSAQSQSGRISGTSTRAVHAGERSRAINGIPTASPIHIASAYFYEDAEELDAAFADSTHGYVYSRFGNPTVTGLEGAVASLDGTESAVAFASGMAAIFAAVNHAVLPGQSIVVSRDVYGATFALLRDNLAQRGVTPHFVDIIDLDAVSAAVESAGAVAILAETASNPLIRVANVPELKRIASSANAKLIIDNTFLSPIVSKPASIGADYVVHSTTKYLGGHGDSTGGVITTSESAAHEIRQTLKLTGAILSPFEAWLIHRGIKTLPLRMIKHCVNAAEIVTWLQADPRVEKIFYPGVSQKIPAGVLVDELRGAMLAFEIRDAIRENVFAFLDALQLIMPAPTLGDVSSLVLYPAMASHRGLTSEERATIGIKDNLVRVSVGIEDAADIIADLDQALAKAVG